MSSLIFMIGLFLISVNGANNGQFKFLWDFITNPTLSNGAAQTQMQLLAILGEFLLLLVLVTVANKDRTAGTFILVLLLAVLALWMVKNPSALQNVLAVASGKQTLQGVKAQ